MGVRALAKLRTDTSYKILKKSLDDKHGPIVRAEIIAAIGSFNNSDAMAVMVTEIKARRERSYRAAVVMLGSIGDKSVVSLLEEVASTDETDWVRDRANESIEEIRKRVN